MKRSLEEFRTHYNYYKHTTMMQQYLDLKFSNQDALLLFRLGDFYELFFDDAKEAAGVLGLAIAKRGKCESVDIMMCGVPFHALDTYLNKLIDQGKKIAISEQVETPEEAKKRGGYKAIVKREIVRIITPGTIFEESILSQNTPSYLMAFYPDKDEIAFAYLDISTGEFSVAKCDFARFPAHLVRINPKEILVSEKINKGLEDLREYQRKFVYQVDSFFDFRKNEKRISDFYKINSIDALGLLSPSQVASIGSILEYVLITQKNNIPKLSFPRIINFNKNMYIDASSMRNLEIVETIRGNFKGSLFSIINHTITKSGSRLLYNYLVNPSCDKKIIDNRLNLVEYFTENFDLTEKIRANLKYLSDVERILTRVSMQRSSPKDLVSLLSSIQVISTVKATLNLAKEFPLLTDLINRIEEISGLEDLLEDALKPEASNNIKGGGFIKLSYSPKLEELYGLIENSNFYVENLRKKYIELTGITNLKINHNNILGLFIEVSPSNLNKINDPVFIHRQSLSTGIRYTTEELKKLESDINNASMLAVNIEASIYAELCEKVTEKYGIINNNVKILNILDVITNFAYIAREYNLTKPIITEDEDFQIVAGRHIIVDYTLKKQAKNFIHNDSNLNKENYLALITGPNMSGKSTYLRQNALIVILAQIGCFVPVESAKIGIVDKLFSRIGASDDLAQNKSTFMVEMTETASILAQSSNKSFIILDEIGRGTSTLDGLSIAWSCLEYIHNVIKARSLFATHYHELTTLNKNLPYMQNLTTKILEVGQEIIFSHKIIPGAADKSYGIYVARLAGLPKELIKRAEYILSQLEEKEKDILFVEKVGNNIEEVVRDSKLEDFIRERIPDPDLLSPKEALNLIYEISKLVKS